MRMGNLQVVVVNILLVCFQIPQPKPPTRWEQFAKSKGIKKVKRSRMVFDEKAQVSTV